ncbi:MAG: alpha/beta hydrolase family esterase [Rubrobacteraceae bacterium]
MSMQENMGGATRLTNAGRLMEATSLIQRTLGGATVPGGLAANSWKTPSPAIGGGRGSGGGNEATGTLPVGPQGFIAPDPVRRSAMPSGGRVRIPEPPAVEVPAGGKFVSGTFTNGAGTRGYKLYVPGVVRGEAVPLVVMLHGCTQNPDDFAAGTRMNGLAEKGGFFVVYPEQSGGANMSRCWNWFQEGDQVRDRGEPSIIAGITHQIAATQPVDVRRIYVAGMSAGAAMAVVMGETYPDLYAAVGVHSGLPYGAASDLPSAFKAMQGGGEARAAAPRGVPTIVFHGDRDTTVNQANGEQVLRRWVDTNPAGKGANAKPLVVVRKGEVPNGHAYTRSVYHDAEGQPVAEGWSVHGAGHAWSGGDPRGSYTDPRGPDASAEMVRFFLEHPRR